MISYLNIHNRNLSFRFRDYHKYIKSLNSDFVLENVLKLVLRILLRLKGYRTHIVKSSEEEIRTINFTNSILSSEGYPEGYLKMLTRYYNNSVVFVIYHKHKLVGSLRLFDPTEPSRILDFWNVSFPSNIRRSEYREMGSLVIDRNYRGRSRWAMTGLLNIVYDYSRKNGVKYWLASAYQAKFSRFKRMNPSCRIMETLEPTESQLAYREHYSDFFDEAKAAIVFVFHLNGASYLRQFKRIVNKKFKKKRYRQYYF